MQKIFLVIVTFLMIASCSFNSDESVLRKEFKIPDSAELVFFKVFPEEAGWFGREGLKIDAVFQLSNEDFNSHLSNAKKSNEWLALPIPKDFLGQV